MDWDNAHEQVDDLRACLDNDLMDEFGVKAFELFGHLIVDVAHSLDVIAGEMSDFVQGPEKPH